MRLLIEKKRDALQAGILGLGQQVALSLQRSLAALRQRDLDMARQIIDTDTNINHERRVLEQQALVILAANQPAGHDLRLIGASLDMISELERIADHAADVARILLRTPNLPFPDAPAQRIVQMGEAASAMFEQVMTVYAHNGSAEQARAAVSREQAVDAMEELAIREVITWLCDQQYASSLLGMQLLWIAHHYERIADRATNLAERLIYIETGELPELNP
ncbi:phosphate signaling complex protein PhoU [Caldichromatium japonicum]|uniref:Phosphate-specific transport system accessory protein PhoU n=1 Tax=Caldichromatium japonicum TaxID=2699430 RepID=A0A6G7VE45_9GAMM|nr:phosphate signaling complex protein PhoU [Caldichromatium japonicum]QIK38291.1 phosphate signaling complex protein PhoU [Caldichromatium japonicum]